MNTRSMLLASATIVLAIGAVSSAQAADQVLYGAIASASGQKLDGVIVSAKREGSTITTSVYTDAAGNYYFPADAGGQISRLGADARLRAVEGRRSICRPTSART